MQGVVPSHRSASVGLSDLGTPPKARPPQQLTPPDNQFEAPRWSGAVVGAFYRAFEGRDFDRMEALYHPNVKFKDMVFEYGDRAGTMKMWRKILSDPSTKIRFDFDQIDGDTVRGHWIADYQLFGRPVHNELTTEMVVKDGKIVSHRDRSDWDRWAPQAFPAGRLFTLPGFKQAAIGVIRLSINH